MIFYNMGNCNSSHNERNFVKETLHHLRRNSIILRDENNNPISDTDIIITLKGMYKRQSIHYYTNLRCKPQQLQFYVPNWWRF